MVHFLQEYVSHIVLQKVRVKSALPNRISYSCRVATSLARKILWKRSSNAKITNFDSHVCSNKEIRGLNIPVNYIELM